MYVKLKQMYKDIKNFLNSKPSEIKYIALEDQKIDK